LGNSFNDSRLYGFFCELRRCKVYHVAVGYGVLGGLIIKFATTVLLTLTLPLWTPAGITIQELRLNPVWDSLRGES
jgi:hypothetical protein